MGSRGEQIAGLLGLGSVFLQVFYCGGSFCGCAVYQELVLLYDIYLALLCARSMLALTSATPGMIRRCERSWNINIYQPFAAFAAFACRLPCTRTFALRLRCESTFARMLRCALAFPRLQRGLRDLRRPPLERDFFFLMQGLQSTPE
jgi:hypothetical protein